MRAQRSTKEHTHESTYESTHVRAHRSTHMSMETYRKKCPTPIPGARHFVRACAVETHMDISEEPFCVEFYRKNDGPQSRARHFVGACAVERHMDISQEPGKNAGPVSRERVNTSIEHRAFFSYGKNPFSVATLFGEKRFVEISRKLYIIVRD